MCSVFSKVASVIIDLSRETVDVAGSEHAEFHCWRRWEGRPPDSDNYSYPAPVYVAGYIEWT